MCLHSSVAFLGDDSGTVRGGSSDLLVVLLAFAGVLELGVVNLLKQSFDDEDTEDPLRSGVTSPLFAGLR